MFIKHFKRAMTSVAVGSLITFASATAYADTSDDQELQLSLGSFKSSGSDSGTVSGEITYGKYVTPYWVLGVIQGLNYAFIENQDDVWTASTVGFANYHFNNGSAEKGDLVPFAGVFLGATYNSDDATGTLGPNLGLKYYVNETTFITGRYRYEWFFDDLKLGSTSEFSDSIETVSDNSSDGNHVISIGLGFRF